MSYGVKYRFEWYNKNNIKCKVDILEDSYASSITTFDEIGQGAIKINWGSGEYNKLEPICASEATIELVQTASFDIDTILAENDFQFMVNIYYNETLFWVGWLITDDLKQPFLPQPNIIQLRAIDGLGILKGAEFVLLAQTRPFEFLTGYACVFYCLEKTGQTLPVTFWNNLVPDDGNTYNRSPATEECFSLFSVHAWSFMTGKNQYESCYDILKKVMVAFDSRIFMYAGEWHVVRTEDYLFGALNGSRYAGPLTVTADTSHDFTAYIKETGGTVFINADAVEGRVRPIKSSKTIFNYQSPAQIIQNQNGEILGAFQSLLSTATRNVYKAGTGWTYNNSNQNDTWYIGIEYDANGYEYERYFIRYASSTTGVMGNSTSFPTKQGDKLTFGFSYKENTTYLGVGNGLGFRVYHSSGKYLQRDGSWQTTADQIWYFWGATEDRRNWKQIRVESDFIPADGNVIIYIYRFNSDGTVDQRVKDIIIDYKPYVYGSVLASGAFDLITQTTTINKKEEREVELSSTVHPAIKGAIFNTAGTAVQQKWKHNGVSESFDLIHLQNLSNFRLHYRTNVILEATIKGLQWRNSSNAVVGVLGLINPLNIEDFSTRTFLPTTFNLDLDTEEIKITAIELTKVSSGDSTEAGDTNESGYLDVKDEKPEGKFSRAIYKKFLGIKYKAGESY